ncbi:trimethylamine methyltransferase family protein [Amphritea spongicola]|nr:trimethylamine methyltransferase family protein [Aliamphritea spongicola]
MLTDSDTVKHTRRRVKRDSRRKARVPNQHLEVPYIQRNIRPYELLTEANLDKIEAATDQILSEIGIEFRDDPVTVELFREAGGHVTKLAGETWNIKFEPGLIQKLVSTAPETFTQHARNPANSVVIGGDTTVFAPSYGSPFVMDMDKGRRYGTISDFENFIKLAQSSPWLHHSGGTICEPTDLPVNKRHLDMVYAHIRYSDRPFLGSITAPERAADSIQMCRILFGEEFVNNHCVIMGNFNSTSPLVWDGVSTMGIRTYAEAGQASIHLPFLMGGAVCPVTIPGAIAQNLAETLVGCALTQLVRPGTPTVMGSFITSMSMRSGSPTFGTPEPALGSLVMGQMSRRFKLPLRCAGNFSTSKVADAQATGQGVMSMLSAVQSGANFILHSAGFLDGLLSMSYEKFVMDTDLCGALHAYLNGLTVDEDSLGVESLRVGGPGEHLFGTPHTMSHYETAYWDSSLNDDAPYETWHENGAEDALSRANRQWKQTLAEYQAPPLDETINQALLDFMAERKASMPDSWF